MVAASDRSAVSFSLSGGAKHDSPEGMKLLFFTPAYRIGQSLLMDRAYEGDKMRAVAEKLGYNPVVPPKKNRINPWDYDRILSNAETRSNVSFEESNASGGSLLAMISSILFLLVLSCSP